MPWPQDLESQLLSLALERAALEAALVGEQSEVRPAALGWDSVGLLPAALGFYGPGGRAFPHA